MFAIRQTLRVRTGPAARASLHPRAAAAACVVAPAARSNHTYTPPAAKDKPRPKLPRSSHNDPDAPPALTTVNEKYRTKMLQSLVKQMQLDKRNYFPGIKRLRHVKYIAKHEVAGCRLDGWVDAQLKTMDSLGTAGAIGHGTDAILQEMKNVIDADVRKKEKVAEHSAEAAERSTEADQHSAEAPSP